VAAEVREWTFLTNHAQVLLCVARDPGVRLRDIAATVGITERSAFGIVTDLTEAGYVVKRKDGRRNRYQIQTHVPLPEPTAQEHSIGEVLAVLTMGAGDRGELLRARGAWSSGTSTGSAPCGCASCRSRWSRR
jgi:Winged helix DNA-binding domain